MKKIAMCCGDTHSFFFTFLLFFQKNKAYLKRKIDFVSNLNLDFFKAFCFLQAKIQVKKEDMKMSFCLVLRILTSAQPDKPSESAHNVIA